MKKKQNTDCRGMHVLICVNVTVRKRIISANAGGRRDAASCKINHIALLTKYRPNYQETSVGR